VNSQPFNSIPSEAPPGEFAGYMAKNFARAFLLIVALVALMAASATWFEDELMVATEHIYQAVGSAGLLAIAFLNDAIVSPLPPEAILLVIAKSTLQAQWIQLVLIMGVLSAAAGNVAYYLGRHLSDRFAPHLIQNIKDRHGKWIRRYGSWTVALAALTPLPFSISCLAAGAVQMPFGKFWWLTLLRIPRFFLFYLTIAFSDRLVAWFL